MKTELFFLWLENYYSSSMRGLKSDMSMFAELIRVHVPSVCSRLCTLLEFRCSPFNFIHAGREFRMIVWKGISLPLTLFRILVSSFNRDFIRTSASQIRQVSGEWADPIAEPELLFNHCCNTTNSNSLNFIIKFSNY